MNPAAPTIIIPHKDTPSWLRTSVGLWLAQEGEPNVVVVDTGSANADISHTLTALERHPRVEVARLGIKGTHAHPFDPVSMAFDYGLSRCPGEHLMTTHTDCFPKHRGVMNALRAACTARCPAVGWQMSPREGAPFADNCMGLSCAMFHVPTLDRFGGSWLIRRAHNRFGEMRTQPEGTAWPDNETCMGHVFAENHIAQLFLGREGRDENQETEHFVHARSLTLSREHWIGVQYRHVDALERFEKQYDQWIAAGVAEEVCGA